MNYKASDLIKRAMRLADIENTDFLTHEELTQYLNDAWQTVFQWLINQGDKQFVVEASVSAVSGGNEYTEYELPFDFYQLRSLTDRYGNTVNRKTDSGDSGYEIVNDALRVYGSVAGDLIATYYLKPLFLTFPDKEVEVESINILDCAGNAVLDSSGNIKNLITQETLGAIEIDDDYSYKLGNGHVVKYSDSSLEYLNYNGNSLYSTEYEGTLNLLKDESNNILWQTFSNNEYSDVKFALRTVLETSSRVIAVIDKAGVFFDGSLNYKDLVIELEGIPREIIPAEDWDCKRSFFIVFSNSTVKRYVIHDDSIEEIDIDLPTGFFLAQLKYGSLISDGTNYTVYSGIPDTIMNFPSDIYFSLISADLGLRFAMKMNANTDGLNNLYTNMQYVFHDVLGQDADYPRIKNAY